MAARAALFGEAACTADACQVQLMRPTERFSSRAEAYARARPSYPPPAIALLEERCGLARGTLVADVGSGTGILSELLLERGAEVFAVEPNDAMRAAAEARLGRRANFHSVNGSAEATTLAAGSIGLLVAAQAFHWFDVQRARAEMLRVLRPGSWAALLWNERPPEATAFLADYEGLLGRYAPEYARITASRADVAAMRGFLGPDMEARTFPNEQVLDLEGLKGRLMSSSYAPEPGSSAFEPTMAALSAVFDRHQREGHIVMPYETRVYFGRPGAA